MGPTVFVYANVPTEAGEPLSERRSPVIALAGQFMEDVFALALPLAAAVYDWPKLRVDRDTAEGAGILTFPDI
jgi:hypothetical protein